MSDRQREKIQLIHYFNANKTNARTE